MTERKVFVVLCMTGEYSDRREWIVAAYDNEDRARDFVDRAEECLRVSGLAYDSCTSLYCDDAVTEAMRRIDPGFKCDYTGARYWLEETRLFTENA